VAPTAGDSSSLDVTGGWLDVQTALQVGAGGTGVASHSAGVVVAPSVTLGAAGTYNLSGSGFLRVGSLTRTANTGAFNMTGGTLSADSVGFSFTNQGGKISPGSSPATMHVTGDLTLDSGVLDIELGGTDPLQYDRVEVSGLLTLGGTLKVSLINLGLGTFVPQLGNHFAILSSAGTADMFDAFDLPALQNGWQWALLPGNVATFLAVIDPNAGNPADFNNDTKVDADDLAIWNQGFGSTNQPNNGMGDATGNGEVDGQDFLVWQQEFGHGVNQVAAGAQVPEPATMCLAAGAACLAWLRRRVG
jgi:hypothetical protein